MTTVRLALAGSRTEPQDGGDPVATWLRELREEVGVSLDLAPTARVVLLAFRALQWARARS